MLVVRQSKTYCAAIALCMVAFFAVGPLPTASAATPTPVTITAVFDFSTFPNVAGNFTTTGLNGLSGRATMNVGLLGNATGNVAHCVVTLLPQGGDAIIIHQQCQFNTSPPQGRWTIVSGTGAYANLNGNGSLTMPPFTEAMVGVIFQ